MTRIEKLLDQCCYCGGKLCEETDDRGTRIVCMDCSAHQPIDSRTDIKYGLWILGAFTVFLCLMVRFCSGGDK